jgi:hypothetical protein
MWKKTLTLELLLVVVTVVTCVAVFLPLAGCSTLTGHNLQQDAQTYYPATFSSITNAVAVIKQVVPQPYSGLGDWVAGGIIALLGAIGAYKHAQVKALSNSASNQPPSKPTATS